MSQTIATQRHRRELFWAWLSFATLLICWDRSAHLDERVSPPRVRLAHALDAESAASSFEARGVRLEPE